jgi:ornithine decarboxylase
VKANPAPEILKLLERQGSCFDVASPAEIDLVLEAGASADRISYGNTIKKERDIAYAHSVGVTMFAVDSIPEVEKVARAAPGAKVYCRLLVDNEGAEWPLSRKFGCEPAMAIEVLDAAKSMGLTPMGLSFHVGSQQPNTNAWDVALTTVTGVFKVLEARSITLTMINMGGGFPAKYLKSIPTVKAYGKAITESLKKHFGANMPQTIIEPGRGMVGDAGVIRAEVVLVSMKSATDKLRWVYLDIGKFTGLAETIDESIRYPITTQRDADAKSPCIVAGPTCDSVDVLYEKNPYPLPKTLQPGDVVWIESAGAYTTSYASTGFNGFAPPKTYCIEALL